MTDDIETRIDEAISLLSDQPSIRSILDDVCVELRELRAQMNRIEAQLQQKVQKYYYTGTTENKNIF